MGQAYYLLGDLEKARQYLEKRLDTYHFYLATKYYGLSEVYLEMGNLVVATKHAEKSIELARNSGDQAQEGRSLIVMGRIKGLTEGPQSVSAEKSILEGIKILQELQVKPYQAEGYLQLGEFYIGAGQNEKALENLQKALEMFRDMETDFWVGKTQKILDSLSDV